MPGTYFKPTPGPPKEPKIMAQYPKMGSIGSIGSMILAILEVQVLLVPKLEVMDEQDGGRT